jgi:glutamine synthetase
VLPWRGRETGQVARIICDVADPDGTPFAGDPRVQLKKVLADAKAEGFDMQCGPEAEFFLFRTDKDGDATIDPHDVGGYFDVGPLDLGEDARRDIEDTLATMGFHLEASHHEVAIGQHEIDFRYADALSCADNLTTFRWVVKTVAARNNMHATFMAKPIHGENGSGMHVNQSLTRNGENAFFDANDELQLSSSAYGYIAGVLEHLPAITAVANPTVNSYKRLTARLPDGSVTWAPIWAAYGDNNRSCMLRLPYNRPALENRGVDSAANTYLTSALMLAAGMEGIAKALDPGLPVEELTYDWAKVAPSPQASRLPRTLIEAVDAFEEDPLVHEVFPAQFVEAYVEMKRDEWDSYHGQVTAWERDRYLLDV